MAVHKPEMMSAALEACFNDRDRAGLLALYAEDGVFTLDGIALARGHAEIERTMAPFLDGPLRITNRCMSCHVTGDLALVRSQWQLTAVDGTIAMAGASAEVLRKEPDGQWRFVIDDATFASRPGA